MHRSLDRFVTNSVEDARKDVLRYYVYRGTMSTGFIAPIIIEFLLFRGMSYSDVGFLTATFMATWLVFEIPAGYLADRFSRRTMLGISSSLTVLAMLTFGFSGTFGGFLVAYVVWGVSIVFRSGIDTAWLYDTLAEESEEEKFASVQGRARAGKLVISAMTALVGAWLATINWLYPFLGNSGLYLISIVAVWSMSKTGENGDDSEAFTVIDAVPIVRTFLSKPSLRTFVVYIGLFFGFIGVASTFIQPIATSVGFALGQLGLLYAALNLTTAVVSFYSGDIERAVGIRRWFLTVPVVVGLLFVAAAFYPLLAIPAFFVLHTASSVSEPLQGQYLNYHTESIGRATVLSTVMMITTLSQVVFRSLGGWIAESTSPIQMLAILSGGMLISSAVLVALESPVPPNMIPKAGAQVDD